MSDAIQQAIGAMERVVEALSDMRADEPLREAIAGLQALQSGEPVVQYYYKHNKCTASSADSPDCICWHDVGSGPLTNPCDWKATRTTTPQPVVDAKPIAAVRGWFHGECVVMALDPSLALPAGMALYAAPQPVVDVNQKLVEALVLLRHEMIESGNGGSEDFGWTKAIEATNAALLSASKGGES